MNREKEIPTMNSASDQGKKPVVEQSLLMEFVAFLGERKKYWLLPIVIIILLLGTLIALTSNPVIAPFIYTIF